ncbi:MAG: type II toxin-antitoxin system RelE/ParE family toxin [Candidatus Aminicenantes bacterium]|nr:type II toxin-antitoxin system RelE/ParE family toxin [Candidatus Aminicenantes bacterium]
MRTIYLESFERDIRKLKEKKIKTALLELIDYMKESGSLIEIKSLKKIKGEKKFYRIRVGDYRLGVKIEGETVTFIRFLHRKDIYRYFP